MVQLYKVEVGLLIASISIAGIGLLKHEQWAHNSWLIPVLVALMWGVIQDKV